MATVLYIATGIGLFIVGQADGKWEPIRHALENRPLTSVAVSRRLLLVGTSDGLLRSPDGGASWEKVDPGIPAGHVRWLTSDADDPDLVLAGTEPAGILRSADGGLTWDRNADVDRLRDAGGWYLPYSPGAGCVRGFALVAGEAGVQRIYAAVEVGGLLVSDDRAGSWRLVDGSDGNPDPSRPLGSMIHPDVHSIAVHPDAADLLTAPTGGGLYRSADGGRTWQRIYRCYIRAAWVDPQDPGHIIAGPADGVSRNGRIEATHDGGKTWSAPAPGMQAPWKQHMVERFFPSHGSLYAILSNGELWVTPLERQDWRRILHEIGPVEAMTDGG
ncbi:MAG TPA: sialidase family protein [Desulfosarcina sp.]|nr:sialidase family protein [Desulfosarcina sp.]